MTQYAIETFDGKEWNFYPDPLYTDPEKASKKIEYLKGFNGVLERGYRLRELNAEEIKEHAKQWKRYCSMID